jgi:hypothetical protein
MDRSRIEGAIRHLQAALALLDESQPRRTGRNSEWFRETGHLTDKGVEHLNSLFVKGKTSYAIAKEMKMSYRAVSQRHDAWRKKNPNPAAWMRQDGR